MIRISQIKFENKGYEKGYLHGVMNPEDLRGLLRKKAAKLLGIPATDILELQVVRHSLDARKKPLIYDIYTIDCRLSKEKEQEVYGKAGRKKGSNVSLVEEKKYTFPFATSTVEDHHRPIVVGAGPAGLFCAYELALHGYRPILLEQGKRIADRKKDVEDFWNTGRLDPNSNVQFGEGGAGTFSDGKLNTGVKDKLGRMEEVMDIFIRHGAPEEIRYEGKPHIGTDRLVDVIPRIREEIREKGGDVFFETKVLEILFSEKNGKRCVSGLRTSRGVMNTDFVVLAIGHSARDTFEELYKEKITMEPKAFAIGLRVEHSQKIINRGQYGMEEPVSFPPAPYKVVTKASSGRGVYSFCMCPGGHVVNASSEEGMLAVNGMSDYARDGKNANSAIIVTITPEDFQSDHVLGGMYYQRELEKKAYDLLKGKVPVEYFADYEKKEDAADRPGWNTPSIKGAYGFANVHEILPEHLHRDIVESMHHFGKIIPGFDGEDTLMDGLESRTSSPVRITRQENYMSESAYGLFPCGEGAGYAGGIMSAAIDGIRTAEKVAEQVEANAE